MLSDQWGISGLILCEEQIKVHLTRRGRLMSLRPIINLVYVFVLMPRIIASNLLFYFLNGFLRISPTSQKNSTVDT